VDCHKWLHLLVEIEKRKADNVEIIEVPSYSTIPSPQTSLPLFKLDTSNEWFVATPYIIVIKNIICLKVDTVR
jgi:hypothetical protein